MMTASQLEPRLHLTPPVLTRPNFGKTSDEDYMAVARANGQVNKIFIFSVLSHISVENWRVPHVSPGGQESAKREDGGARVCQKVCITSVNTLPCRIKRLHMWLKGRRRLWSAASSTLCSSFLFKVHSFTFD